MPLSNRRRHLCMRLDYCLRRRIRIMVSLFNLMDWHPLLHTIRCLFFNCCHSMKVILIENKGTRLVGNGLIKLNSSWRLIFIFYELSANWLFAGDRSFLYVTFLLSLQSTLEHSLMRPLVRVHCICQFLIAVSR